MTEAFATAAVSGAAGLLLYATKRAALGDRPVVPSIVCWWRGGKHDPKREPMGFRCTYCLATAADLSEWGYDSYVSPLTRIYEREHGSVTREEWR